MCAAESSRCIDEWHTCACSEWPDLSTTCWHSAHTHTHSTSSNTPIHVSLDLPIGKARWNIKNTLLRSGRQRWKLISTRIQKYTLREKLGHQMPLFFDTGSGDTNFFPCVDFVLAAGCLDKRVVFSEEDNFSGSISMGFEWNDESNDQEDGNRGVTWTNSWIYLEFLKSHCDLFCLLHNAHSFEGREMNGQNWYCDTEITCPVLN